MSSRDILKHSKNLTNPKHLNNSVYQKADGNVTKMVCVSDVRPKIKVGLSKGSTDVTHFPVDCPAAPVHTVSVVM